MQNEQEAKREEQMKKVQAVMYSSMLKTMADKLYSRGKQGLCKEVGCENKRANGSSRCGECSKKNKIRAFDTANNDYSLN
jgi:hypothetical protein